MAAYRSWAQTVIRLDFYEKPVQHFCNSCQEKLCAECVPIHVNEKPSMSHDVLFRNRQVQLVCTECELHEGQRCQVQCRQCHIPICIKCCTGPHKHHDNVDIEKLVEIKKRRR